MASLNFRTVAFFGFYVGGITTAALFVAGLGVMRYGKEETSARGGVGWERRARASAPDCAPPATGPAVLLTPSPDPPPPSRFRGLSPEIIQGEAMRRIVHTPAAMQKLGGNVKPGAFNAFARRGEW